MLSYFIPKRWEMAVMLFFGAIIAYTLRVNMSVAAQQMKIDLGWSETQTGLILSAFYWGYAVGQVPAPMIVHRLGAKWVFALAILLPGIVSLFMPQASRESFGLALFLRFLVGLFESITFPAVYQFIPMWIPLHEKTLMVPFIYAGTYVGNIIGFSVSGSMLKKNIESDDGFILGGWDACFYIFGIIAIAYVPYWATMAYERPDQHPRMTKDELDFINEGKHFPSNDSLDNLKEMKTIPEGTNDDEDDEENTTGEKKGYGSDEAANHAAEVEAQRNSDEVQLVRRISNASQTSVHSKTSKDGVVIGVGDVELADKYSPAAIGTTIGGKTTASTKSVTTSMYGSMKHPRYEDDHLEHDISEPIALEHLAFNMINTQSSRIARIDGRLLKQPAGRPRKISIVHQSKHRQDIHAEVPWFNFFTHPVSLTLFINSWCSGWISFTLMSEMPAFLSLALGFDLSKAGILCVFPYIALFCSAISFGWIFEHCQLEYGWTTDRVRRTAQLFAFVVSTIFLVICGFMQNKYVAYAFMIITQASVGAVQSGLNCAYSDVAPNYSSALNTVGNCVGAVAGIVGPLVISALLESYPGIWAWRIAFFLSLGQGFLGTALWFKYQTSKPVPELNSPTSAKLGYYKDK